MIIKTMTSKELSKELTLSESKVRASLKSFLIAGKELNYINNNELYLERGYSKWADYVQDIFDIQASYSYKLINAYGVVQALTEMGFTGQALPQTESQCRPMVKLFETLDETPRSLKEVWTRVLAQDGKPTAAKVEASVNVELGITKPGKPSDAPKGNPGNVQLDTPNGKPSGTPAGSPASQEGSQVDHKKGKDKSVTDGILSVLENSGGTGLHNTDMPDTGREQSDILNELAQAKADILRLESELMKARRTTANVPKSKMALELYKAGFKALAASTTPEQMDELMALKTALLG